MRKVKIDLQFKAPSWNFCNHDGPTSDGRYSKQLCRFCVSTKQGHYCSLHDEQLAADKTFVYKAKACIDATAGFATSVTPPPEPQAPTIDPKLLIRESIMQYQKTVSMFVAQGYPQQLAEKVAMKYMTGDK